MPKQKPKTESVFIDKYFTNTVMGGGGYAFELLPMNEYRIYVSSTILNGIINYVEIMDAYVAGRYHDWDELIDHEVNVMLHKPLQWTTVPVTTKAMAFEVLTKPGATFHVKPDNEFYDDVHILAKATSENIRLPAKSCYYYFWFDRDGGDCCIGRFQTSVPEEEVRADFQAYMTEKHEYNEFGSRQIPLHYFNGWIS